MVEIMKTKMKIMIIKQKIDKVNKNKIKKKRGIGVDLK